MKHEHVYIIWHSFFHGRVIRIRVFSFWFLVRRVVKQGGEARRGL